MEKQIIRKIIKGTTILIFALFFLQVVYPSQALAANELNWENPNSNSNNNPYKFKLKDSLNSELIMQVVGCTGVVDKVSGALTNFASEATNKVLEMLKRKAKEKAAIAACKAAKGSAGTAVATVMNTQLTGGIEMTIDCKVIDRNEDSDVKNEVAKNTKVLENTKKRDECLNGIAITLAKNQLTSMTRYTMNWINTGFNGDPMYVRNITSFTNSIEKNILEKNIAQLSNSNKAYPYGTDFSRSAINGYKIGSGFRSGATNFLDSLTSDLGSFLSDPESYYGYSEKTAMERAQEANERFSNDFSVGGWNGWLALTQRDQNNPLGFTMQASQYLADQQENEVQNTKEELLTNNGFLSQKKCAEWQQYLDEGIAEEELIINDDGSSSYTPIYSKNKSSEYDQCVKYEVVTPGSIIRDKLGTYINSPERQLELADTINESLNSLFSALISKFQNQGLSSLSTEKYEYTSSNMGVGYGSNVDLFTNGSATGGYINGSFDLTRDLGNTYIHEYTQRPLGTWNANTGIVDSSNPPKKLYIGVGPFSGEENIETGRGSATIGNLNNVYYTVSVAGNTKLFNDGYNGWAKNDRAFWNGREWQNWKVGTTNPIKKRGVIQIQKDYIVAAKEILSKLPNIMPKIGELDYCIPGPNPNWEANSGDAYTGFSEYAYSLNYRYTDGNFFVRDGSDYSIAQPGSKIFDTYKNIFSKTNESIWSKIIHSQIFIEITSLGLMEDEQENDIEEENAGAIEAAKNHVTVGLETFVKEYNKAINNLYGKKSLMQTQFLEKENSYDLIENSAWLQMSEEGLNITKNIGAYNEDINQAIEDYKNSIVLANANIYKLDKIRQRVSEIIKVAQDRRDENLIKILNEETVRDCNEKYVKCMSEGYGLSPQEISRTGERGQLCTAKKQICLATTLTEAQYKEKYKECLEEEDILYYDDTEIMSNTGGGERCDDELDNDLDGLIDREDPDCSGNPGVNTCSNGANNPPRCTTQNGQCLNGAKNPPTCDSFNIVVGKYCKIDLTDPARQTTLPNNIKCEQRQTELDCTEEPYIRANRSVLCYWDGPSI